MRQIVDRFVPAVVRTNNGNTVPPTRNLDVGIMLENSINSQPMILPSPVCLHSFRFQNNIISGVVSSCN